MIQSFLQGLPSILRRKEIIDSSEETLLESSAITVTLPFVGSTILPSGETYHEPWPGAKEADVQIFKKITDPHGGADWCPPLPVLVVEVGVSETYAELIRDARHWLEQTQGEVRVVVLVKVFETQDYKEKRTAGCGKDVLGVANADADSSDDSTGSSYTRHLNYFRTHPDLAAAYAGTFSGFVEVWRYSATARAMCQDGARIPLLPLSPNQTLTLSRKDFALPPRPRRNHLRLSLGPLARDLASMGQYRLAYWRWQKEQNEGRRKSRREKIKVEVDEDVYSEGYPTDEG